MEENMIFGIAAIGLLCWAFILVYIIRTANSTVKRDNIQRQNRDLLALMAEKLGVDVDRINTILKREP